MNFWLEVLWNVIAYAAVLLVGGAVALLLLWLRPGLKEKFWPLQRLRKGEWSGLEVFLAFAVLTQVGSLVQQILEGVGFFNTLFDEAPSEGRQILWASPLFFFLVLALIFGLLYAMSRTRPRHYGLTPTRWPQGVLQGIVAFALAVPPVLVMYGLILLFQDEQPHELQKIAKEGLWPVEWLLLAFLACVVAPVLEEITFRGLLQGWLRRASLAGHVMVCVWALFFSAFPLAAALEGNEKALPLEEAWYPLGFAALLVLCYAWIFLKVWRGLLREGPLYMMVPLSPEELERQRAVARNGDQEDDEDDEQKTLLKIDPQRWGAFERGNGRLAILGSAMLFASMHGAWPSPIPLFLLGLVLGWLTHRTQSLVGPILLHACFNAVAFGSLLLSQTHEATKGKEETAAARPWEGGKTVAIVPGSQQPLFK